ncbi:ABC transporter substrate-binding protein [Chryseotalea sanaruensis]|uniref:ABC transporter substrate-binding protein n=1 Tax=Chryseotalea sanaruensis TaxID=2482724 RepID=A0A401UAB9_9BACT|nr:transporter substrate-binding domain-containing protein [Chryseotalea sanaruensis]GCC51822.1 ABC transporter substrate-binding protein [Chryseotalea sanaruensis]
MKTIKLIPLLFLISTVGLFAQGYTGDTWAQVKATGKGTVSMAYVETPSFVYKDASGKLTGICVDIMTDFVKWTSENKKVSLTSKFVGDGSSFRGMYDKTKASVGGVFGLGNITITDERKKEVKFSPPFITNFAILITQNSVPTLAKFEDLPNTFGKLTGYTAKGTLNEKRILELKKTYFPAMKIAYTATSQETLEKVMADPNGFAYLDLGFYLEAVNMKKSIKRHPIADKAAEQFGFVLPLNSDWYPVLEEFFNSGGGYLNSAQYRKILVKHLGETGVKLLQSAK